MNETGFTATLTEIRTRALASLIPPPCLQLSQWINREIMLPEGTGALPGRVCLWLYQRDIADAISYPEIERGTLVKPVCVGFTTLLTGAIGSYVANEPAPRKFGGKGAARHSNSKIVSAELGVSEIAFQGEPKRKIKVQRNG